MADKAEAMKAKLPAPTPVATPEADRPAFEVWWDWYIKVRDSRFINWDVYYAAFSAWRASQEVARATNKSSNPVPPIATGEGNLE